MFPFSPLKRNLWSYWKWQTFDENISYNSWEGDFFQEYIEMELKIFSKSVFFTLLFKKRGFGIAKTKHSNCNF